MFGATFVFPLVMGLDANLAIMFSGICTILFLLITTNKVPSYLGTSASFVASVAAIRAQGGDSADVTGAIMVAGLVLLLVGVLVHFAGAGLIHAILPPAVTGAVVMLIGFNLAPVVAGIYWPAGPVGRAADRDVHGLRGGAAAGLLVPDRGVPRADLRLPASRGSSTASSARSTPSSAAPTEATDHDRVSWAGVKAADWIGLPSGTARRRRRRRARPELLAAPSSCWCCPASSR